MTEDGLDTGVPHQVPPAPLRFVNRETELAAIGDLLGGGTGRTRIAVLPGLPGVGKSSLVQRYVEQVGTAYPGGELFVDFGEHGAGADGESVSDAIGSCLRALGVAEALIPARLADRVGLYRTKTAGKATLVVLDDVTEPAQVRPFVPKAPGSAVLVTSGSRLSELRLDGADEIRVEPLSETAAVHLLREWCGVRIAREPDDAVRLARECGYLPVALRVMAARLIGRTNLTVRELADEVADERRGLDAFSVRGEDWVRPVFSVAYLNLSPPAARLYRLLGGAPAVAFTTELVAAAARVAPAVAAELIDVLVEAGLLRDDRPGRYRFHTLPRRHALEQAMAEEPDRVFEAGRRLVEFLLCQAAFADLAVTGTDRYRCVPHDQVLGDHTDPFDGDKTRALDWMDDERPNVVMAVRASVEHGWHDLAWQLAESATALYANRRYLVDWTETSELGATAAGIAGHPAAEARLRSFSSRAWVELGKPERARAELDTAFTVAEQVRDVRLLASIWEMDGRYHEAAGEHVLAERSFHRSLDLFASVDDQRGIASLTYFLGCSQQTRGELELARDTLARALTLLRDVGDSKMIGRALITIGGDLEALGRGDEARSMFEEAAEVLAAGSDLFHESWAREALADLADRTNDPSLARTSLLRMIELHTRLGSTRVDELTARLAAL